MDTITLLLYILGSIAVVLILAIILLLMPRSSSIEKIVRDMFDQKKSLKEILEYGKKYRWNEREVKLYYLAFVMQDFKQRGYNLDEVRSMSEDSGWPSDIIDIVLKKLK